MDAERISVVASFGAPYKMRPVRFKWAGQLHDISDVTYIWTTVEGAEKLYHFSVTDGSTLYEICFNSSTLRWHLRGVEAQQ